MESIFVEDSIELDKVLHVEPFYIDLIRDLGAGKGENEWKSVRYLLISFELNS